MGFNTNRQKEIFYLIEFFEGWFEKDEGSRKRLLKFENKIEVENILFKLSDGRSPQARHLILFYIHPDYYHPIVSSGHKKSIVRTFSEYLEDYLQPDDADDPIDHKIHHISGKLLNKLGPLDSSHGVTSIFYNNSIMPFWNSKAESSMPGLDVELLAYKKQIVLYGPPGTGKTYTSNLLAKEIIRYVFSEDLGVKILDSPHKEKLEKALSKNIHPLQLHPAYSYEDFIRGLHIKGGDTTYVDGYLLDLIKKMNESPEEPHVLILDEINRVDLSRLFGECFSALENRGVPIELIGGDGAELCIPENLYIIGTMNLIDHSVEQIDFALRRRFLWVEANYSSESLKEICKELWGKEFEKVEAEFSRLVDAADKLNQKITDDAELGKDFMLGHVFFLDTVAFLKLQFPSGSSKANYQLFTPSGVWKEPIEKIWRLSLLPILSEYLSGVEQKAKIELLKGLKTSFSPKSDSKDKSKT